MTVDPDGWRMASADRCTVHPQHWLVNKGRDEMLDADVYRCDCGKTALSNTDEAAARRQVLVSTDDAAALVGVEPRNFRQWAQTRGLRATKHVRAGRSIRALWDADLVYDAERLKPTSTWGGSGRRG